MLAIPLPDYGCFLRWPENGRSLIHPDDVAITQQMVPSTRVLKRVSFDDTYYHYRYGKYRFRMRPGMWLKVKTDGIDVGDQVETVGLGLEQERFVAHIWGMHYVQRKGCILYRLRRADQIVPKLFAADQLRLLVNKAKIRPGMTKHKAPSWDGSGSKITPPPVD